MKNYSEYASNLQKARKEAKTKEKAKGKHSALLSGCFHPFLR
ncbi:hypothetical protein ACSAZK_11190 [Methanosarcina sp. Mfa9]